MWQATQLGLGPKSLKAEAEMQTQILNGYQDETGPQAAGNKEKVQERLTPMQHPGVFSDDHTQKGSCSQYEWDLKTSGTQDRGDPRHICCRYQVQGRCFGEDVAGAIKTTPLSCRKSRYAVAGNLCFGLNMQKRATCGRSES